MATGLCGMGLRLEIGRRLLCWDCPLLAGSVICSIRFFVFYTNNNEQGSAASNKRQAFSQKLTQVERDTVSLGIKSELFMLDIHRARMFSLARWHWLCLLGIFARSNQAVLGAQQCTHRNIERVNRHNWPYFIPIMDNCSTSDTYREYISRWFHARRGHHGQ